MIQVGPDDFTNLLLQRYALERRVEQLEAENAMLRAQAGLAAAEEPSITGSQG